jgi:hypothetical protein
MEIAMRDLGLKELMVVYPGTRSYELGNNIRVLPLSVAISELAGKKGLRPRMDG